MIKAVIFDADSVLINSDRFSEALRRDYPVDAEKEKEFFATTFQECLLGPADLKQSVAPYLSGFGWNGTVDEFLEYWFKAEHTLNNDLIQYVQTVRQQNVWSVIATNHEKYRIQYLLENMGLDGVFDKVYSSAHLGLKKPAVEFFSKVVQELQLSEDEVVFWGDEQQNIDGATTYGIHAERYTDFAAFVSVMKQKYNL